MTKVKVSDFCFSHNNKLALADPRSNWVSEHTLPACSLAGGYRDTTLPDQALAILLPEPLKGTH